MIKCTVQMDNIVYRSINSKQIDAFEFAYTIRTHKTKKLNDLKEFET